jgi:hypothetical protein
MPQSILYALPWLQDINWASLSLFALMWTCIFALGYIYGASGKNKYKDRANRALLLANMSISLCERVLVKFVPGCSLKKNIEAVMDEMTSDLCSLAVTMKTHLIRRGK